MKQKDPLGREQHGKDNLIAVNTANLSPFSKRGLMLQNFLHVIYALKNVFL